MTYGSDISNTVQNSVRDDKKQIWYTRRAVDDFNWSKSWTEAHGSRGNHPLF